MKVVVNGIIMLIFKEELKMNFRFRNNNLSFINYILASIQEKYDLDFEVIDIRIVAKNKDDKQVDFVDKFGDTPIIYFNEGSTFETDYEFEKFELVEAGLTFFFKQGWDIAFSASKEEEDGEKNGQ